jgi:hypothetical protein
MASPRKLTDGKVIWKSNYFDDMIFTDFMLKVFKRTYPKIIKFQPELEKAEAWLLANPERVPKKNFARFINNWMRIANERDPEAYKKNRAEFNEREYPQEPRTKPTSPDPFNFGDVLKILQQTAEKEHTND